MAGGHIRSHFGSSHFGSRHSAVFACLEQKTNSGGSGFCLGGLGLKGSHTLSSDQGRAGGPASLNLIGVRCVRVNPARFFAVALLPRCLGLLLYLPES